MKHLFKPFMLALALSAASCAVSVAVAADLYREDRFRSLVGDVKAYRVGDNLTVMVMETSSAAATADTNARRKTDAGIAAVIDGGTRQAKQLSAQVNNDFDGAARTQRSGKLLAQITVTVTGVEPNGDLHVSGEQQLEVNNEKQMIRLEGKVRPQDIGDNNAVVSNRIADARIHYIGDGVLAEGQRPGLITRVLTWLGL